MVRFQSAIDNAVSKVDNDKCQKVKNAQEDAQRLLDKVMEHKQDMIDVIDTWRYINEKGLAKYFNDELVYAHSASLRKIKTIGVSDAFIGLQFNDWRKTMSGPYNWYVFFNGKDLYISINKDEKGRETAKVTDMIADALYREDDDKVILPIYYEINGDNYYTCHDCSSPLNALAFFANHIEKFCTDFFNETQNINI